MTEHKSNITIFFDYIANFKKIIISLLDVLELKEEIKEIEKYYCKLLLFKKVNPKKCIELFYTEFYNKYTEKINNKDDTFFLEKIDHIDKQYMEQYVPDITSHDICFINHIKPIWGYLSKQSQNNIWSHIILLCKLSEKIIKSD